MSMKSNRKHIKATAAALTGFLVLLFSINSQCHAQDCNKGKQLALQSFTDTCSFRDDMFQVCAILKCKGLLPRTVYTNKCISENVFGQGVNEGEMFLIVKHNGQVYRYFESVMLYKHGLAKNRLMLPLCSIKCSMDFYMKSFHPEKGQRTSLEQNKDFGLYSITAVYVDKSNDTIFSNPISIWYLE